MTRTGSSPPPSRALDDRGFSIMELLVGMSLTLVILASTLGALADGVRATDTSRLLSNMRHNVRSGLNLMNRDLMQAGQGIPQGGIPIPSGFGASPVVRPGPGSLVFPSQWQAIPAVTPGSALGGVFHGRVTDMVAVLYADATLPLNTTALSSISGDGSTVVVDLGTTIDGPSNAIAIGDLIMFTNPNGNALQEVTGVTGQILQFAQTDTLNLNQPGASAGSIVQL